jgi:hypothetical protein
MSMIRSIGAIPAPGTMRGCRDWWRLSRIGVEAGLEPIRETEFRDGRSRTGVWERELDVRFINPSPVKCHTNPKRKRGLRLPSLALRVSVLAKDLRNGHLEGSRKSDRDIGTSIGATSSQSVEVFLNPCQLFIYSDGSGDKEKSPGQNGNLLWT